MNSFYSKDVTLWVINQDGIVKMDEMISGLESGAIKVKPDGSYPYHSLLEMGNTFSFYFCQAFGVQYQPRQGSCLEHYKWLCEISHQEMNPEDVASFQQERVPNKERLSNLREYLHELLFDLEDGKILIYLNPPEDMDFEFEELGVLFSQIESRLLDYLYSCFEFTGPGEFREKFELNEEGMRHYSGCDNTKGRF